MMMVMMIVMVGREGSKMRLLVGMIMFKMRTGWWWTGPRWWMGWA